MKTNDILRVLANTADGVYAVGNDHKIIFWNKAARNILGYTAKEVLGRLCNEIVAGVDRYGNPVCSRSCRIMKLIKEKRAVENSEMLTHTKTAVPIWLSVSIICIPGTRTEPSTVVHLFHDITKRKIDEDFIKEFVSNIKNSNKSEDNLLPEGKLSEDKSIPRLTFRERQVLMLLAEGKSTKHISEKLLISLYTVRKHIQNILSKLEAHSMLEAVAHAQQNNLI